MIMGVDNFELNLILLLFLHIITKNISLG